MGEICGISESEILFWPSGDVDNDCLESLLVYTFFSEMNDSERLDYYRLKRTNDFNLDYPTYEPFK
jgi:hypothetical protein